MKAHLKIKTATALLVALLLTFLCSACGSPAYRDDVSVTQLAATVNEKLSGIDYLDPADENYITVQQKLPLSNCTEYMEMIQTEGIGIDEYGLFKMKDAEAAEAMRVAAEAYLTTARAAFNENYAPNERPKIDASEVRVYGLYVVYAVLSDSEKTAVFSALEAALKKN